MAEKLNNSQDQSPQLELDKLTDQQIEAVLEAYEEVSDEGVDEYQDNDEYQKEMRLRVTEALMDTGFDVGDEIIDGSLNTDQLVTDALNEGLRRDRYTQEFEKDVEEIERLKAIVDAAENPAEKNKEGQDSESFKLTVTSSRLARRMAIQDALKGTEYESGFGDAGGAEGKFAEIEARIAELESKYGLNTEADSDAEDDIKPSGESEAEPEITEPEAEPEPKSESEPENKPELEAEDEPKSEAEPEPESSEDTIDTDPETTEESLADETGELSDQLKGGEPGTIFDTKEAIADLVGATKVKIEEGLAGIDARTLDVVESFNGADSEKESSNTPEKKKRFSRLRKIGAAAIGVWNRADLKVHEAMIAFGDKRPFQAAEQQEHESDEEYEERLERRGAVKTAAIAIGALAIAATASIARQKGWLDGSPFELHNGGGSNVLGGEAVTPEVTPDVDSPSENSTVDPNKVDPDSTPESDSDGAEHLPVVDPEVASNVENLEVGEGWHQTLKEMGVSQEEWDIVLADAKHNLLELGVAYEGSEEVLGKQGIGISYPGKMPEKAIDAIIDSANGLGISIDVEAMHSRYN